MKVALLAIALTCTGCAALPAALVLDATVGGIGIVQKWKARQAERELIDEVRALREEVARLRQWPPPVLAPLPREP